MKLPGQLHGFAAIARLADDLHVGLRFQNQPEAFAHHGVIVGQQNPQHVFNQPQPI
jgi:hypothetical protein